MSMDPYGPFAEVWQSQHSGGIPTVRFACLVVVAVLSCAVPAPAQTDWDDAQRTRLVSDVNMPTDIDVAHDGAVWFTEIEGQVLRFDPEADRVETVYELEDVVTGGERGLVGFALAHDHGETGAFYLYYSRATDDPDGGENRIVRVEGGRMSVLASLPAALEHNGGRIVVEPNGTLFVGTGENAQHGPAQDLDSLLGKVLRMTPEGAPVEGNLKGLVYSYGHRNVYGLALEPETGELWATENMGWRRDEVNRIEAGGNYGYPECEGEHLHGVDEPCPRDKGYVFPVVTFYEDRAAAPTGAAFLEDGLYWGSFNDEAVHRLREDPETGNRSQEVVLEHTAPVLDLHPDGDGWFFLSAPDGIWHIGERDRFVGPGPEDGDGDGDGSDPRVSIPAPAAWLALLLLVPWVRRIGSRRHRHPPISPTCIRD